MSIPIYLAAFPEEAVGTPDYPAARLGCRLSQDTPALLAPDPPDDPASLMVLRDETPPAYEPTPALARMLATYAQNYHAGLVCDWRKPVVPFYDALAILLDEVCTGLGLPLWLTDCYAGASQGARVMIGSGITEGRFAQQLASAASRWPGRCVLSLLPLRIRCVLSAAGGAPEMEALPEIPPDTPVFFSEDLCCMYFSRPAGESVAFTLYDTGETIGRKLQAAEDAGFQAAIGPFSELAALRIPAEPAV